MFKDPKITPPPEPGRTPVEGQVAHHPPKPWEDRSLPLEERLESYKALVCERLEAIRAAFDRAGEAQDVATQKEIMNSPETKKWMDEGAWLQTASVDEFCKWAYRREVLKIIGRNFLGAKAWRAQGIDVGEEPPLPDAITKSLLESDCPICPGKKIKDTHLLVLVPEKVNGEPYSALKLDELCAARKGSGERLVFTKVNSENTWKHLAWASTSPTQSEWVLIPKGDPNPATAPDDRHFRKKSIAEQQLVLDTHYKEYREARVVEIMTAAILNDLSSKERIVLNYYLRCQELNASGERICVGVFLDFGFEINEDFTVSAHESIGYALALKL